MDVESTELSEFRQMKLLRRGRYGAPIAENKRKPAGLRIHRATKIHAVSPLCNLRSKNSPLHSAVQWRTSTSPTGSLALPSSPQAAPPASSFSSATARPPPPAQSLRVRSAGDSPGKHE